MLLPQIMTAALPDPCERGRYTHPFGFTLPTDLPGVLDAHSLDSGPRFTGLHATIKYTLKATVKVHGRFVSDLEAVQDLVVRQRTSERVKFHAVERTVSKRMSWMKMVDRGTCHVAVSMARDTFRLGENAQVECFVNNHTSAADVRHVKCRLYQDVTLKHPQGGDRIASRPVMQLKYQGPTAGDLLERTLHLPMAMKVRFPTASGAFLSCAYRISLECEYSSTIAPIKIDIPIVILPPESVSPTPRGSNTSSSVSETVDNIAEEIQRTRAGSGASSTPSSPSYSTRRTPGPTELLMTSPMPARKSAFLSVSPRQSATSNKRQSLASTNRSRLSVASMRPQQAPTAARPPPPPRPSQGNRAPPPPAPPMTEAETHAKLIELLNSSTDEDDYRQSAKSYNSLGSSALMGLVQNGIVENPMAMTQHSNITNMSASPFTMSDNLSLSPRTLPRTVSSPRPMRFPSRSP